MTEILLAALFRGVFFLTLTTFMIWAVKRWNRQILSPALFYRRLWVTVLAGSVISAIVPAFFQISIPLASNQVSVDTNDSTETSLSPTSLSPIKSGNPRNLPSTVPQEQVENRVLTADVSGSENFVHFEPTKIVKFSDVPPTNFLKDGTPPQPSQATTSENLATVNKNSNQIVEQNVNIPNTNTSPPSTNDTALSPQTDPLVTTVSPSVRKFPIQEPSTTPQHASAFTLNEQIYTKHKNQSEHENHLHFLPLIIVQYRLNQWIFPTLLSIWLCGIIMIFVWRLFLFTQITRLLDQTLKADRFTQRKWETLLREYGIASARITLRMHETIGPALARTPHGVVLILPESLWLELDESLQMGILRHELAHYLHRDTLYTPLLFYTASLQWFNPCAWYALYQYGVTVEWCCDEFAYGCQEDGAALLAETFLRIHQTAVTQVISTTGSRFAKFGPLDRVNRLLSHPSTTGAGRMKQYVTISTLAIMFVIVFMCCISRLVPATRSLASETESIAASNEKTPTESTLVNGQATQTAKSNISRNSDTAEKNSPVMPKNEYLPFPTPPTKQMVATPRKFVIPSAEQKSVTLDEQTAHIDEQISNLPENFSREERNIRITSLFKPKSVNPEAWENRIGMKFQYIPAGEFIMGLPATQEEPKNRYSRQHKVTLTQPFYMGVYEITRSEYLAIMGPGTLLPPPAEIPAEGCDRLPAECASWTYAPRLVQTLNTAHRLELEKQFGAGAEYIVPTEAQWEYACRAGTTTPYHFGFELNGTQANCDGQKPYGTQIAGPFHGHPIPVGSYAPNAWGLYDMHGNMEEWCQSDLQNYPKNPVIDPVPHPLTISWITHGGSWNSAAEYCRAGKRGTDPYGDRCGMRVAIHIPDKWLLPASVIQPYLEANRQHPVSWTNNGGMNFRLIPTGKAAAVPASANVRFIHPEVKEVQSDHPYYLGTFEVTQRQWESLMEKNPSYFSRQTLGDNWNCDSSDFPVERVNLKRCQTFVTKMNETYGTELREVFGEHARYTLPTISQWVYACRACTDTAYYWGDMSPNPTVGCLQGSHENLPRTCRVGLYPPNPWGLYDMFGNVAEICWTDEQKLQYDQSQYLQNERVGKIPPFLEFAVGFTPQFGEQWIEDGGYQEKKGTTSDSRKPLDVVWSCGGGWHPVNANAYYGTQEWNVPEVSFDSHAPMPSLGLRLAITLDESSADAATAPQTADTTTDTTTGTLASTTVAGVPPIEIIDLDVDGDIPQYPGFIRDAQQQERIMQRQRRLLEQVKRRNALAASNMEVNMAVLLKQFDLMFDEQLANQPDEYKDSLRRLIVSLAKRFGERPAKIQIICKKSRISQEQILANQFNLPARTWARFMEQQPKDTEEKQPETPTEAVPSAEDIYFWSMYSETIKSVQDLFVIVNGEVVSVNLSLAYGGPNLDYTPQDVFGARVQMEGGFYAISTPEFPMELAESLGNISTLRVLRFDSSLPLLPQMIEPITRLSQLKRLTLGGDTFYFVTPRKSKDGKQKNMNRPFVSEDWKQLAKLKNLRVFIQEGDSGNGEIFQALAELPHLETLRLSQLTEVTREQFESLNRYPALRSIDISHLQIHPEVDTLSLENQLYLKRIQIKFGDRPQSQSLLLALRNFPELTEMNITTWPRQTAPQRAMETTDQAPPMTLCLEKLPQLQQMTLQNIDQLECDSLSEVVSLGVIWKLPEELAKRILDPQQMPKLESLLLQQMQIGTNPMGDFFGQLPALPLENLFLHQIPLNQEAIKAIAQLPKLSSVSLDSCQFDTQESCVEPLAALANSSTLKRASITYNHWGDSEAKNSPLAGTANPDGKESAEASEPSAIVRNLPVLESLTVHTNSSSTRRAVLLANLPSLKQLNLSMEEFADGTDTSILEKFSQYDPKKIREQEAKWEAKRRAHTYPWSVDPDFEKPPVHEWTEEEKSAITRQQSAVDAAHPIQWQNGLKMSFQLIPAGEFTMGVNDAERQVLEEKKGVIASLYKTQSENSSKQLTFSHQVKITRSFYMGTYEVTQKEWKTVMGDNPSYFQICENDPNRHNEAIHKLIQESNPDQFPVENVFWRMARQFVELMNSRYQLELEEQFGIGAKYVLPTEAQWEYACRAGTTTAYHFGNNVTSRFINMQDRTAAFSSTRKVGSYLPNAWGLYDCHGNVAEWCADWFAEFPEERGISRTDPTGPLDGKGHVLRGGDLHSPPSLSRSAFRSSEDPLASLPSTGVRLAIYVPQKIETDMQEAITRQQSVVTTTRPITWKNAFGIPFQLIPAAPNTNNTNTRSENSTAVSTASTDMPSPMAEPTSIPATVESGGLDESFYMAQYELTFRSFQSFVDATHYETTANRKDSALVFQKGAWHIAAGYHWQRPGFKQRDHMPVVCVSREDAEAFIAWLNQAASDELHRNFGPNARYALPTEAQWEYVFHTGSEYKTSFVDKPSEIVKYGNLLDQRAIKEIGIPPGNIHSDNISSENIFIYTAPVGRFAPSPWGIYDLHGNVREWCTSGHDPSQGVVCGSGWSDTVAAARRWSPQPEEATYRQADVGFRLVILHPAPQTPKIQWTTEEQAAIAAQKTAVSTSHPISWKNSTGIDFRLIPQGEFFSKQIELRGPGEYVPGKSRRVVLTHPFYMGTFEVTRDTWKKVMGETDQALMEPTNPPIEILGGEISDVSFESGGDNFRRVTIQPPQEPQDQYPITRVSWESVQNFIIRLNEQDREELTRQFGEDAAYVLPTEAQWEYACRAGTTTVFHFGDRCNGREVNCNGSRPYGTNVPGQNLTYAMRVGSYAPNAWGLYDCHGNVAEWCNDWFDFRGWRDETTVDPTGLAKGQAKLVRGGHFWAYPIVCGSAYRASIFAPTEHSNVLGFRLAIRLP